MGCDIHCHIEIKVEGTWHHYSAPNVDRSYRLFARMAGVRNTGGVKPIAPNRGLPARTMSSGTCSETGSPTKTVGRPE